MFERLLKPILENTITTFPITALTGPRQSGKTTLIKQTCPNFNYFNLEDPDNLLYIQSDPKSILTTNHNLIIDEAQKWPLLFSYLQAHIDQNPHHRYVLSGSQNILLQEKITQSLAGRCAYLELFPLSYKEFCSHPNLKPLPLWEYLYGGTYPRPYHEKLPIKMWYSSYIKTYLERDVRNLLNIRNLSQFQLFLKFCAARHGQLLNLSNLSQDTGLSHTQIKEWISLLEASYIIFLLRPFYKNFNKRLVKTPKLYFYDSALVCQLLEIDSVQSLQQHIMRGAIFEGFVISEIIKYLQLDQNGKIYFWRDHGGNEIDLILERNNKLFLYEIKSSSTFNVSFLSGLDYFVKQVKEEVQERFLVYTAEQSLTMNTEHGLVTILSWNKLCDNFS